jgi:hypothetical protein
VSGFSVEKETALKSGDHVKVIGRDGFFVFLEETQGTVTLRPGGKKSPEQVTLAIPMQQVISLEKTK